MSDLDSGAERPQDAFQPVADVRDEDVPARRLLAHDLPHLVWEDGDDERPFPPPD